MKRSLFTDRQVAFILRRAEEGTAVEEVCRKAGTSIQTYGRWRKKHGGLMPSEMRRLKQLEEENVRLGRLVAGLALDREMLQDVVRRKPWGPRAAGRWWTISGVPGGRVRGGPALCRGRPARAAITAPGAARRPSFAGGSEGSPRSGCATAGGGSTCSWDGKAGW